MGSFLMGQIVTLELQRDRLRAGILRLLNDMDANGRLSDCSFGGSCISAEVDRRLRALLNGVEA